MAKKMKHASNRRAVTITIEKRRGGKTTFEVNGVEGPECLALTKQLRQDLVGDGDGLVRKSDFDGKDVIVCRDQRV